jgi:hypothetical protein
MCVRAWRPVFTSRLLSDVLLHFHSPVRGRPSSGVFFDGSCLSVLPQNARCCAPALTFRQVFVVQDPSIFEEVLFGLSAS